jgi:hypothetical protein
MAKPLTEVPNPEDCRWGCSICGAPVELQWGRRLCPGCGCPFTVKRQERTGRTLVSGLSPVPREALAPAPGSACAEHADREAAGVCERCGSFACEECSRFKDGRRYCPGCIPIIRRQIGAEARRKSMWITALVVGGYLLWVLASFVLALVGYG